MKKRNVVWYILLGTNVVLLLILGILYGQRLQFQQSIAGKVLRFHVVANSDTKEDQALKLKVRDAVGSRMAEVLAGATDRTECEQIVAEHLGEIEELAQQVIAEAGYAYTAEAFIDEVEFPVKTYGAYTFPPGEYEALEIVIGDGAGKNWWCVMYPNMCFAGSVYEVVDEEAKEELRAVLSEEEYEQIFSSGNYEIRWQSLSFLEELWE